jgi:thiamine-monophosphate kinase
MRLADVGELRLLERLRNRFPPISEDVIVGIGDDAAVLDLDGQKLLLSTDTMTEDIHFNTRLVTPYQIASKLVASNVSDIFAMGGKPVWSLLSLSMPSKTSEEFLERFLDGISEGLKRYGVQMVGGDITGSRSPITVSMTVGGVAGEIIVRRSGASAGERVYLSGPVGESACGYELLRRIGRPVSLELNERFSLTIDWTVVEPLLKRFLLPEAVDLSEHLRDITSMIDVSDGLFLDLIRLCKESSVGVRIYEEKLPITPEIEEVAGFIGLDQFRLITAGGEDYQQLFTSNRRLHGFIEIGEIITEGYYLIRKDGSEVELRPEGYQHFVFQG